MKTKCSVKGCPQKGVYTSQHPQFYCRDHKALGAFREWKVGAMGRWGLEPYDPDAIGWVCGQGRDVGQPVRAWRWLRARKEVSDEEGV